MQWPWLLGALALCLALGAVGVVLILDHRGLATRHARATVEMFRPIRPSQSRALLERRVRHQLRVDRLVGAGFVLGSTVVVFGILAHVIFG